MFHRLTPSVAGLLALAVAGPVLSGCPHDPARSECTVEAYEVTVPHQPQPTATPLMLLPDARLDAVNGGFVLLGTDGNNVRWARLTTEGQVVGDEQSIEVPAHSAGPWFAVAGNGAPADHVVIAYVAPLASDTGVEADLMTFSVSIENTKPSLPVSSGQIPASAQVAMSSGRGGMNAAIAWAGKGRTSISVRILRGDARVVGPDLIIGTSDLVECLRFSPGTSDLTLGYVDRSGTPPGATFVGTELTSMGTAAPSFKLNLGLQSPGCVELVPNGSRYGVAWHSEGIGTYFSEFDPASTKLASFKVLSDVQVREPPGLGGLGWLGKNYAVVFVRSTNNAEVWPIDLMGQLKGSLQVLPSAVGHAGKVSVQPIGSTLYATYADYASSDPADLSAGQRLLVKVSCP